MKTARDTLGPITIELGIKWPNDIMANINGVYHKLCGILVEQVSLSPESQAFIIGIGMNVSGHLPNLDGANPLPTNLESLAQINAKSEKSTRLAIIDRLLEHATRGIADEPSQLKERWQQNHLLTGDTVTIRSHGHTYTGQIMDIDPSIGILFRLATGEIISAQPETTTVLSW